MTPRSEQNETDEIDERLSDLWSLGQAEQERCSRMLIAVMIGFIAAFGLAAYFIASR